MGCSSTARVRVVPTIVLRTRSAETFKVESVNTLSSNNPLSAAPSYRNPFFLETCLKVKIRKPFSRFLFEQFTFFDSFSEKIQKIKKVWLLFTAFTENFEFRVHGVCVPEYDVNDGLEIFAVLVTACQGFGDLELLENLPFVKVRSPMQKQVQVIADAWKELTDFLIVVQKKALIEKLEKYKEILQKFIFNNCEVKNYQARKAVKFVDQVTFRFNDFIEKSSRFVQSVLDNPGKIESLSRELVSDSSNLVITIAHHIKKHKKSQKNSWDT